MHRGTGQHPTSCYSLVRQQWVPQRIETVFAFFAESANLEQLTPPWLRFHIKSTKPVEMNAGTQIEYRVRWHGVPVRWVAEIAEWEPPLEFADHQLRGPLAYWHHLHMFEPEDVGTHVRDIVRYKLPLGIFGEAAHRLAVRRDLHAVFDYREQRIFELFGAPDA
jgi:ligand-binding SRPBCC domain-containing protein